VEFFKGWKPLSPLQLAVEEVMLEWLNEASIYSSLKYSHGWIKKAGFLDSDGRSEKKKGNDRDEQPTVTNGHNPTATPMLTPTDITKVTEVTSGNIRHEATGGINNEATKVTDVRSEHIGNIHDMNNIPSSYANKLNPTSLTKANLRKLKTNVPNDADYDVWLPLASIQESNYARILIRINACNDFSNNLVMSAPNIKGTGYTEETIPPKRVVNRMDKGNDGLSGDENASFIEVTKKKSDGNNSGNKNFKLVLVKPKTQYRPKTRQMIEGASPKTTISVGKKNVSTPGNGIFTLSNLFEALIVYNPVIKEIETINKASTSDVQEEGKSSTPIVEKINIFEKHLLEGKCVLIDYEGKPLEKVDYLGDQGTKD
nr:hypothetical protein [Tanacetum cinerariifolium]